MKRLLILLLLAATPLFASDITRDSVIAAMNACRAKEHLPALHDDARLDAAAEDRMHDMEDVGYWDHESPDGRSPFVWLPREGYVFQFAGENLATGFETTELLVSSWMESPGHRANILSPNYTECGVAMIDGGTTRRQPGKSVVVLFGCPKPGGHAATR